MLYKQVTRYYGYWVLLTTLRSCDLEYEMPEKFQTKVRLECDGLGVLKTSAVMVKLSRMDSGRFNSPNLSWSGLYFHTNRRIWNRFETRIAVGVRRALYVVVTRNRINLGSRLLFIFEELLMMIS